jgi:hypothetical protein
MKDEGGRGDGGDAETRGHGTRRHTVTLRATYPGSRVPMLTVSPRPRVSASPRLRVSLSSLILHLFPRP